MSGNPLIGYLGDISATVMQIKKREPGPQNPDLEFPEEIRLQVVELLKSIPELKDLEEKRLSRISGGSSISFFRVAISILERLSLGANPEKIYDDLIDFVSRESTANFYLAGIGGIALTTKLILSDKISIITADEIAPSAAREFVFRIDRCGKIIGDGHEPLRPQAALMVSNNQQVFLPRKSRTLPKNSIGMDAIHKIEQVSLFCLTLASEHAAPVLTAKTSWIDHPANSYHGLMGGGGGTSPGQQQTTRYDDFDTGLFIKLFENADLLNEQDQAPLFLAVERLRRSRLHESAVDRAIDLGIAFEILFLHNIKNNQELSYRAGMRAAFLLGANEKERRSVFDVVRDAYQARSTAVHEGRLVKERLLKALPLADDIFRKAAIQVVRSGGFPEDWDALMFSD